MHVGTLGFLTTAAYIVIFGFLWRTLASRLAEHDSPIGKAMGFIY